MGGLHEDSQLVYSNDRSFCVRVHKPSGLSAPGCSGGGGGLPPGSAVSDGWSGIPAAAHQTHSGQISLHRPHFAKKKTRRDRQLQYETDRRNTVPGEQSSQVSMKSSLKVPIHTDPWCAHGSLLDWTEDFSPEGMWINLPDRNLTPASCPYDSVCVCVNVSTGWSKAHRLIRPEVQATASILLCLWMKKRSVAVTTWFLIRFPCAFQNAKKQMMWWRYSRNSVIELNKLFLINLLGRMKIGNENKQRVCQRLYFLIAFKTKAWRTGPCSCRELTIPAPRWCHGPFRRQRWDWPPWRCCGTSPGQPSHGWPQHGSLDLDASSGWTLQQTLFPWPSPCSA